MKIGTGNYFTVALVLYLAFDWMHAQHDEIVAYYPGGWRVTYVADAATQTVREIVDAPDWAARDTHRLQTKRACVVVVDARNWQCGVWDTAAIEHYLDSNAPYPVTVEAIDGKIKTYSADEKEHPINVVKWYWERFLSWSNRGARITSRPAVAEEPVDISPAP